MMVLEKKNKNAMFTQLNYTKYRFKYCGRVHFYIEQALIIFLRDQGKERDKGNDLINSNSVYKVQVFL